MIAPIFDAHRGRFGFSSSDAFTLMVLRWIPLDDLSVMDLGCAGGAMVGDFHDTGCLAVGIEGTDKQKNAKSGNWGRLENNLFTADITVPFHVYLENHNARRLARFSLITAWEVLEHIGTDKIRSVMENIDRHLVEGGVVIMSISPVSDMHNGVELHQTIRPESWWIERFSELGFRNNPEIVEYFGKSMVRAGELEFGTTSFHVALSRNNEEPIARNRIVAQPVDTRALGVTREGIQH